ncbi:MAG TPA: HIT domain-containing protein [Myxococcales bacterium]|nr:HIT domain-containing protein [Myxococcales bacterium]
MEQLWAPWRMELISKGEPVSGCIFCELPLQRDDRKNLVLGRTARTFAILNKYPYNNGHLMVVPRAHVGDVHALSDSDYQELCEMLRIALRLVGRAYAPQGANLGMNLGRVAGAGIADHLHWHVVPRWGGDTNFMPVLADSKVMIEHLDASWDRLRPLFEAEYRWGEPVASW